MSNLTEHAYRELHRAGWFDPEEFPSCGKAMLAAVAAFSTGGWSGSSAPFGTAIVADLLQYRPLGPLTDDPGEWVDVTTMTLDQQPTWQNRRDSRAMSYDRGRTYWLVERETRWAQLLDHLALRLAKGKVRRFIVTHPRRRSERVVLARDVMDGGELGCTISCYRCGGDKTVDEGTRRCPECDGTGELHSLYVRPMAVVPGDS